MSLASTSESPHADRLLVVIGGVSGACVALSQLTTPAAGTGVSWLMVLLQAAVAAQGGAALLWVVRAGLRWLVGRITGSHGSRAAYARADTPTYAVFLLTLATAAGVQLVAPVVWALLGCFAAAQWWVVQRALPGRPRRAPQRHAIALTVLCAVSGLAACVAWPAWQRTLARVLGAGVETATMGATAMLLGLCVGVVAGARLARRAPAWHPVRFAALEGGLALFAVLSLPLMQRIGEAFADWTQGTALLVAGAVLAVPGLLLGAALLVSVAWMRAAARGWDEALARVLSAALVGGAAGCFVTMDGLFAFTGLRGATWLAAGGHLAVACAALVHAVRHRTPEVLDA